VLLFIALGSAEQILIVLFQGGHPTKELRRKGIEGEKDFILFLGGLPL